MDFYLVADGKALAVVSENQKEDLEYLEGLRGIEFMPVAAPFLTRGECLKGKVAVPSLLQEMGLI